MIRIVLLGRTGNNMFQYALGRVLAAKHGVPLVLDGSWFNARGWSEVSHFLRLPIQANVVRKMSHASRALLKASGKHHWEFIPGLEVIKETEGDHSFDSRILDAPADCMLFGYFQSPRYFASIASELRTEINTLLNEHVATDRELADALASPSSIAVHVRRTDFLSQPAFQVCGSAYYQQSMDSLRARIPEARFFIFSDDPAWCRGQFRGADEVVVDSGDMASNPLVDLRAMSMASHHIIANSSYSWWAAWLGEKPGQKVLMPDRWFAGGIIAPIGDKLWRHGRPEGSVESILSADPAWGHG